MVRPVAPTDFAQWKPLWEGYAVNGEGPGPGDIAEEVHGELPAGWPFAKKWIIGFEDDALSAIDLSGQR